MWLSVCIHMMNQNAYPADREGRSCGSTRQRATRDNSNGNHAAFVNCQADPSASVVACRRQP